MKCNITQFIYFWKTALHVLGGISTHHQEHTQLFQFHGSVHHISVNENTNLMQQS